MNIVKELVTLFLCFNAVQGWLFSKKCCDDIKDGFCFDRNVFGYQPECPSQYSPTFTLFTRPTSTPGVSLSKDSIPSQFSNDRKTIFIVHGWNDKIGPNFVSLKNALLEKDDWNVIEVDWRNGADSPTYYPSAENTKSIGALIGSTVTELRKKAGSSPYFWCIGHSLGAHACSYTTFILVTADLRLDRITGLDPAGLSFGQINDLKGLTKVSAKKVDVIHTDPIFGSKYPRGDVDFYPNEGKNQPGCPGGESDDESMSADEMIQFMLNFGQSIVQTVACSHLRAVEYMTNSVENTACYEARNECSDYSDLPDSCTSIASSSQYGRMGYDAINKRYSGILHLEPSVSAPYCVN